MGRIAEWMDSFFNWCIKRTLWTISSRSAIILVSANCFFYLTRSFMDYKYPDSSLVTSYFHVLFNYMYALFMFFHIRTVMRILGVESVAVSTYEVKTEDEIMMRNLQEAKDKNIEVPTA